ncbi:MAG: peptide chain release factor 2 [Dongiaceae bacterium]
MQHETQQLVEEIKSGLDLIRRSLDWDRALKRLNELNQQAEDPNLWNNAALAQGMLKERTRLDAAISAVKKAQQQLDDSVTLLELAESEGDAAAAAEAMANLKLLQTEVAKRRLQSLLSGEADANACYIEINAGAGGTESQDWAQMLERMYVRWAEQHGYKIDILEESTGEQAGIKSATLQVNGDFAYGWLKTESGVHRLVRISPFDANARRHTSFASVWVYPVIDESIDIEILDKDIQVDVMRASGAGGQHVNKTSSAVRMTHMPTGIVVKCQSDRSQHRNRTMALQMLKARLYEAELQKREAAHQAQHEAKTDIGWGHQIRSYVLQPYQMVKDLRTNVEIGNAQSVLDGNLDPFLEASLASKLAG